MKNVWLFAREGGYKEDYLAFTSHVVQLQLEKYRVPPCIPGRQIMITAQNAHANEERYDNKGHDLFFFFFRVSLRVNAYAGNLKVKLSMFATN